MACIFFLINPGALAAQRKNVVMGANVFDEGFIPQTAQDAEVSQLAENGVKTIRTGLGINSIYFITQGVSEGWHRLGGYRVSLLWFEGQVERNMVTSTLVGS